MTIPRTPDGEPQRRINVELLDRIEQQITEHPETWFQDAWFRLPRTRRREAVIAPPCGTTLCVAGWAAVLSGYRLAPTPGFRDGGICVSPEGDRRPIDDVAVELLGLSSAQASDLFFRTVTDLDAVRQRFAELREAAR